MFILGILWLWCGVVICLRWGNAADGQLCIGDLLGAFVVGAGFSTCLLAIVQ